MLTRKQAHDMERAHRSKLFFDKEQNKAIIATYEPFEEEVTSFEDNLTEADKAAGGKEVKPDVTTEKDKLKHEVAKNLSGACRKTMAYATKYGQTGLAAAMNVSESSIYDKKDEDIKPFFEAQDALIEPLLTDKNYQKYKVTKEVMDAIRKQVEAFHGMIGQSGVNEADYSAANAEVDKWLKAIAGNVDQMNLLVDDFAADYPGFVKEYHDVVRLGDDVIRHSGIEGLVQKKGTAEPMAGAVVMLADTEKKAVSAITGDYRLVEVNRGWYYVVVTVEGTQVARVLHKVEQGKVAEMNFEV